MTTVKTNDYDFSPSLREQVDDVSESSIMTYDEILMKLLLIDKTTRRHILWASNDYIALGSGYEEFSEILPDLIIRGQSSLIQPRITKSNNEQVGRTRGKAEVFTPSWICNVQNNLIDEQWFGRANVFNTSNDASWVVNAEHISFESAKKNWKKYVDAQRLEIACGEAPYLVSRYDTVNGESIPIHARIGLLDRKMRVVKENAETDAEWLFWSQRAVESVYGYEYQGDSLLLARENILFSYIDYFIDRFQREPGKKQLRKIARIVAWNLWQMDGLKYVIPGSCHDAVDSIGNLMGAPVTYPCAGCVGNDIRKHNGIYCKIQDWREKAPIRFIDMQRRR